MSCYPLFPFLGRAQFDTSLEQKFLSSQKGQNKKRLYENISADERFTIQIDCFKDNNKFLKRYEILQKLKIKRS